MNKLNESNSIIIFASQEYLRLPLSDSNREACNQELLSRGFFKRAHKDDPVPEEYAEGTKRMEL